MTVGVCIRRALRAYRSSRGISQATAANNVGIGLRAYVHLESGRAKQPKCETLERIAKALGTSTDALLGIR